MELVRVEVVVGFKDIKAIPKPTFFQKLISKWTRKDQVHVEVAIGDKWIAANEDKGVFVKEYNPGKRAANLAREGWVYKDLGMFVLTSEQMHAINTWIDSINGSKYDWLSILTCHIISIGVDHRSKWTCSELAGKLLQLLYYPKALNIKPERLTPGDIYELIK